MLFYIRHKDKEYRVRVESRRGEVFVRFQDEKEQPVDLTYYGNDCTFIDDSKVFAANVLGRKNDYTIWRPEGNVQLQVESEYRRIVSVLRGQDIQNENAVHAKMPGKIVKILAKPGAHVEKGASVLVMEAMKMENEIRSPISGEVSNLHVNEGQAVETGALLMELKPDEN